jgi:hypothetical protein
MARLPSLDPSETFELAGSQALASVIMCAGRALNLPRLEQNIHNVIASLQDTPEHNGYHQATPLVPPSHGYGQTTEGF